MRDDETIGCDGCGEPTILTTWCGDYGLCPRCAARWEARQAAEAEDAAVDRELERRRRDSQ